MFSVNGYNLLCITLLLFLAGITRRRSQLRVFSIWRRPKQHNLERELPLYPQLKMLRDLEENWTGILFLKCIYCCAFEAFCGGVCVGRVATGAFHFKGQERLLCIIRRTSSLCSLTHLPCGIKSWSGSALGLSWKSGIPVWNQDTLRCHMGTEGEEMVRKGCNPWFLRDTRAQTAPKWNLLKFRRCCPVTKLSWNKAGTP